MTKIFIFGALGGVISVLIKINKLILDPLTKTTNRLDGISRTIIAGVSSIIIYLGYKSGIVSFLEINQTYTILLISFFAGFSERFIPDFSNKMNGILEPKKSGNIKK